MQYQLEDGFNGNITFLFNEDGATLRLMDNLSGTTFVEIELNPKQLCEMFSHRAYVPCNIQAYDLDRVGKKLVMDTLKFEMPLYAWADKKRIAGEEATKACPEGWFPDLYFGSQDSFFRSDGKEYAQTTIRKWINVNVENS